MLDFLKAVFWTIVYIVTLPFQLVGWIVKWIYKIIRGLFLIITKPLRLIGNYKG